MTDFLTFAVLVEIVHLKKASRLWKDRKWFWLMKTYRRISY